MAQPLVSDELWTIIQPHIPVRPRRTHHPGRKPLPGRAYDSNLDRQALHDIGATPHIPRRYRDHGSGLGKIR